MSQTQTSARLKASARSVMSGHYKTLTGATFLFLFLDFASTTIPAMVFPASTTWNLVLQYAVSFLISLLVALIEIGYFMICLRLLRGQSITVGDLLYPFYHHADRFLLICLLPLGVRYLLTIPGTIGGSFVADYLFGDSDTVTLSGMALYILALLAISAGISLIAFFLLLPLSLLPFLSVDRPDLSPIQIYRESARLMKGQYLRYLKLLISFIGIFLLSKLSLDIGKLWTEPYITTTKGAFYMNLLSEEPYREYYE